MVFFHKTAACLSPLGMESRLIKNNQITASSQADANHAAYQGRLNFLARGGKQGGWSASTNDLSQWIQVDLLTYTKVTGVSTQGRNAEDQRVAKYKLQYSDDGDLLLLQRTRTKFSQGTLLIHQSLLLQLNLS